MTSDCCCHNASMLSMWQHWVFQNCSCVKTKKACVDRLPSRRSCCLNLPQTSLSDVSSDDSTAKEDPQTFTCSLKEDPKLTQTTGLPGTVQGYNSMATPTFKPGGGGGGFDFSEFAGKLVAAFHEIVQWRKNCFRIPQGSVCKALTSELARLFHAFTTGLALESVALKVATVIPVLLLQNLTRNRN